MDKPRRKRLPHDIPSWVESGAKFFVTINCQKRGVNELCRDGTAEALLGSVDAYEQLGKWWVHVFTVMPDHVHIIASFGSGLGLKKILSAWKGYQCRQHGIDWQENFFDHRLRTDDEFIEKAHYVRMNPVRAGLVDHWEAWPYTVSKCASGSAGTPRPT